MLDKPNDRSLHKAPIPRTGGLAIVSGVTGTLLAFGHTQLAPMALALPLAAVSFADDLWSLPPLFRLSVHLSAACGVVWLLFPGADAPEFLLLALGITWFANLFNFMDGSDGLAGGMAVVGFGACAIAAHAGGVTWIAVACVATSSAAIAFLIFNFPPARIFMGDSGSIPLGFLAGAMSIAGWKSGVWEPWFPMLVFSPFAVDATLTLIKRLLRRQRVWEAHREHYYQRLVRMGLGHRNTALAEYALMISCASTALATRNASPLIQGTSLALFGIVYTVLAHWIDVRWANSRKDRPV